MSKELYLLIESYIANAGKLEHLPYFIGLFVIYKDIPTMQKEYESSPIFCKKTHIDLEEITRFQTTIIDF